MNDPTNIRTVPAKWAKKNVVYDKKYHWVLYKPSQDECQPNPCVDCNRVFYGDDGKTILKLHRIINHVRVITHG